MRYVVSDIHGNYDLFVKLLRKINFSKSDTMFVCGDVIDKRFVISRGVGGHTLIPRIANPRELVILHCVTRNTNKQN